MSCLWGYEVKSRPELSGRRDKDSDQSGGTNIRQVFQGQTI
jgi:hypothetical protein